MESPVVLDKPPEYHDRGFPFDEEEGAGGWSELAARHPDIAARLRQRPATWARKRRPSSQDATEDFGDNFGGFDRFPFDDIPPEFREHFPSHFNRRFGSRDEHPPSQQQASSPPQQPPQQPQQPQQNTAATQTEQEHEPQQEQHSSLPQYGLRNTVDLGVKSPAEPSVVDAERSQRCMSAPPAPAPRPAPHPDMSAHNQPEPAPADHHPHSNVRHIPIFVEGRDEPVINKNVDHGAHYEPKPHPQPHPQQHPQQHPHVDRDQYFADDGPVNFHHPTNFSRAFGTPFNKNFRQGPQPFTQQKAYPQSAFARGASPQRSHSPKQPAHEEPFAKVPVHHEQAAPKPSPQPRPQQTPQPPPHQPSPQREPTPPHQPKQPSSNDPITQILSIQTDVLNLMTEVENFTGTKKEKRYIFLDEMLTRNLIKLDNIETEGKENIRLARKEAIRCIQKCIAVLEAKAENNANPQPAAAQAQDVDMKENSQPSETPAENGEVDMKEAKAEPLPETQQPNDDTQTPEQSQLNETAPTPVDNIETQPAAPDATEQKTELKPDEKDVKVDNKLPKKKLGKKNRDKSASKDSKDKAEPAKDSNKTEQTMQVDDKGDKAEPQTMEVDAGASQ